MAAILNIQRKTRVVTIVGAVLTAFALSLFAVLFMDTDKAEADTLLGWSGSPGPSRLFEDPGALCSRSNSATTGAIVVQPPQVWARSNYTSGQTVGYRVRLYRTDYQIGAGNWQLIATSPGYTRTAYPNSRASFPSTGFTVNPTGYAMEYYAVVYMYWYNQYGQLTGTTSREVDVYLNNQSGQYQRDSCRM